MNRLEQIKKEVYTSKFPPDYEVSRRLKETYAELHEASKYGETLVRDTLAKDCVYLQIIQKDIHIRPWVNL